MLAAAVLLDVRSRAGAPEEFAQAQASWSFQLSAFLLGTLLLTVGTLRLAEDTELVWFSALPLPARAFFPYRALRLAAARLIWAAPLWAFLYGVAAMKNQSGEAAWLAMLFALALHLVNCTAVTAAEFCIRSRFSRKAATRIQLCCLLVGAGLAALVFAPSVAEHWPVLKTAALRLGTIEWPATLAVRSLLAPSTGRSLALLSAFSLQCAGLLLLLCLAGTSLLRRQGLAISEGIRDPGGGRRRGAVRRHLRFLSPFARRELSLLTRDSRYIMLLLTPVVTVVAGVAGVVLAGAQNLGESPRALLLIALGIVIMVVLWGGAPFLVNETRSVWMLFTLPVDLRQFLARKVFYLGLRGWVMAIVAILVVTRTHHPVTILVPMAWAALVAAVCAPLSVSMAVLSFDRSTEKPDQARLVAYLWVFLGVGALMTGAIALAPPSAKVSILIVLMLVALAFWQRANERFPLLLDVDDAWRGHPRLSIGDGIVALLTFFLVQQIANHLLDAPPPLWPALAIAAATTVGVTTLWLRRRGVSYRPILAAQRRGRALFHGALWGGACVFSVLVIHMLARRWWPAAGELWLGRTLQGGLGADLLVSAILAAPAEEYIFRGMLFPAMRRSMRLGPSVALSSVVFAAMHPAASVGPALLIGTVCAFLTERDRALVGAIVAHLVYNLAICLVRL